MQDFLRYTHGLDIPSEEKDLLQHFILTPAVVGSGVLVRLSESKFEFVTCARRVSVCMSLCAAVLDDVGPC